jgi:hypothetical protein
MPEQTMVSGPDRIQYEGVFSVSELFRLIDEWLLDKGYYRVEPKHVESAKPEGKFVELELTPGKELTDYAKALIRIKIQMSNIKDVTLETPEGKKQKLNQGTVLITISSVLETDYQERWEAKPLFLFIRTIYDKYIFRSLTGGFEGTIKGDVEHLKRTVSGFLNLHRYTT